MGHVAEIFRESDTAKLKITWTDPESVAAPVGPDGFTLFDPTNVVLTVKDPVGGTTTPIVTHASLGVYYAKATFDKGGDWVVGWVASGVGYSRRVEFLVPVENSRIV